MFNILPFDLYLFSDVKQSYKIEESFLKERKIKIKFGGFINMINHFFILRFYFAIYIFPQLKGRHLTLTNVDY